MKLHIQVTLDSGGTVTISGDDLTAEGVNEVFAILGGYSIESSEVEREPQDEPLPTGPITDDMKDSFVEGFREGRTEKEEENT